MWTKSIPEVFEASRKWIGDDSAEPEVESGRETVLGSGDLAGLSGATTLFDADTTVDDLDLDAGTGLEGARSQAERLQNTKNAKGLTIRPRVSAGAWRIIWE